MHHRHIINIHKILNSNPLRVTKKVIFAKLVVYRFGVFV